MRTPSTILQLVNPGTDTAWSLNKAVVLARHCNAALEVFVCDALHGYWLERSWDRTGIESARCQLVADTKAALIDLLSNVDTQGVRINVDATCECPYHWSVARKIEQCGADLVIKTLGMDEWSTAVDEDAHLIRTCSVPLLLTQLREWPAAPRIGVAVDVSSKETPGLQQKLVDAATWFGGAMQGQVFLVHAQRGTDCAGAQQALNQLADEFHIPHDRVQLIRGEVIEALPRHVVPQDFSVIVIGALGHAEGLADSVGTLTFNLLYKTDCDLLLVKPENFTPRTSLLLPKAQDTAAAA